MEKLVLIGFGTVGQGFLELLVQKKKFLKENFGLDYKLVAVCDSLKGSVLNNNGLDMEKVLKWVKAGKNLNNFPDGKNGLNALETIEKANGTVMFEATYTDIKKAEPATTHIKNALDKGMDVVTTNKGPIALYYKELSELAKRKKKILRFEGTVMAGTPVFSLLQNGMAGCEIKEIKGILNGTTNFILTKMEEGLSYEEALKIAQDLGYAEAVPDADVLGWDALAKVCILANVVFGARVKPDPKKLECIGITEIKKEDIFKAKEEGKRYKLIGKVWKEKGKVKVKVSPELLELSDPLSSVMGSTNALSFINDALNSVTIVGPGAGRKETGYAMLNDFILIHKNRR
ncbi:MAG: homoserine dehydrogenase [Thermoanaerobaculia bacterium]